jgi:Tfp pilus assembly protein FimT
MTTALALWGLMASFTLPWVGRWFETLSLNSFNQHMLQHLSLARQTALSHQTRVCIQPPDSGSSFDAGWQVFEDLDRDLQYTPDQDHLLHAQGPPGPALHLDAAAHNLNRICFAPSGMLQSTSGNYAGTVRWVYAQAVVKRHIIISRTGRARLCDPQADSDC